MGFCSLVFCLLIMKDFDGYVRFSPHFPRFDVCDIIIQHDGWQEKHFLKQCILTNLLHDNPFSNFHFWADFSEMIRNDEFMRK